MNSFIIFLAVLAIFSYKACAEGAEIPKLPVNSHPPEDENFPLVLNSTTCGDLLIAHGGFIKYRYNEQYKNNERCIWTLRTPKWQTSFLMHSSNFHSVMDYLGIYVLGPDGVLEEKARIDSTTGNRIVGAIGPTVFLVFVTDDVGRGNGFLLEYFGFGYTEASGFVYDHSHFALPSGHLSWPEEPVDYIQNAFSTFTLSPSIPNNDVALTLTVDKVDLISLRSGCQNNFLSVHQLLYDGFTLRLRYCEADFLTSAKISSSSPLLLTYTGTIGPQQKGIQFLWNRTDTLQSEN